MQALNQNLPGALGWKGITILKTSHDYALRLSICFLLVTGMGTLLRAQQEAQAITVAESGGTPAAVVNGRAISKAELEAKAQARLVPLQAQEYALKRQLLDDVIDQMLLEQEAARRGVTVAKLVQSEIDLKTKPVNAEQASAVYESNKDRYSGKTEAEALAQAEISLRQIRTSLRRTEFLKQLRDQAAVSVLLDAPRQNIRGDDTRAKGPRNAPVTIVEFAEFQCPYCGRSAETVKQLEEKYGDKIRLVFRDFPLIGFHEHAAKAAEAGSCANEQGKFWEMYDKLFANQSNLKEQALEQYAAELKLDTTRFSQCLNSGKYSKTWQKDSDEGSQYGVTGTPTFFINGRMLVGNLPFDKFAQVIDEELARARTHTPVSAAPAPRAEGEAQQR
jgi:protein-disulfide isomerase